MTFGAVIFDFDGTLIDSIPAHREAIRKVAAKHGLIITDEEFAKYNGMEAKEGFKHILEDLGVKLNLLPLLRERAGALAHIYGNVDIYPQTKACLKRLQHYPLAVATSSSKRYLTTLLKQFDIANSFQVTLSRDDIKEAKPNPEIFIKSAKALGERPESCVVIEDSINGIKAAKRAGMAAIALLTTTNKALFTGEAEPDLFINDLDDLDREALEAAESKAYIRRQLEEQP